VTGFNSSQYAADPANAIREAARVTADSGLVVVAVWGKPSDNEYMSIDGAVARALPQAPGGPPPFGNDEQSLSELVRHAGLTPLEVRELRFSFDFEDLATAVYAQEAPGASQRALGVLGVDKFRKVVEEAYRPFVKPDGHVRTANMMVFLVARK
jgi:hypothetical protein